MIEVVSGRYFISGGFADCLADILLIQKGLQAVGLTADVKLNNSGATSEELIRNCDVFIAVIGLEDGAIKTPTGETLPQLELNLAIRERRPVIAFLRSPERSSASPSHGSFRQMIRLRLHDAVIAYENPEELPTLCQQLVIREAGAVAKVMRPYKVFICHSSIDKPVVERIVQRLAQANVLTFYDRHGIGVGMSITNTIRRAIAEVGYVLVCLSPKALESQWVRQEIAWGLEHAERLGPNGEDFILPVRVAPFVLPDELKFLGDRKYADVAADFESGIQAIIAAVMR